MKSYSEYKAEYKKLFNKYQEATSLINGDQVIIETIQHFDKHGTKWIITDQHQEEISPEYYFNVIDPRTIQFFKNLGGKEIVKCGYTLKGFLPVLLISINPSRDQKTERHYQFKEADI